MGDFDYSVDFSASEVGKRKREMLAAGYLWNDEWNMPAHRVVAYEVLGRFLLPDEHVHHIDHNKQNNKPDNLVVLSPEAHQLVHLLTEVFGMGRRWSDLHHGPGLTEWAYLKEFLDSVRISYEYLGPGGEL